MLVANTSGSRGGLVSSSGRGPLRSSLLRTSRFNNRHDRTNEMSHRRLVDIDVSIASAHTVRVVDGEGMTIGEQYMADARESLRHRDCSTCRRPVQHPVRGGDRADGTGGCRSAVLSRPGGLGCVGSARPRPMICVGSCLGTPRPAASTPTPWSGCRCRTDRFAAVAVAHGGTRSTGSSGVGDGPTHRAGCGAHAADRQSVPPTHADDTDHRSSRRHRPGRAGPLRRPQRPTPAGSRTSHALIEKASKGHRGVDRGRAWIDARFDRARCRTPSGCVRGSGSRDRHRGPALASRPDRARPASPKTPDAIERFVIAVRGPRMSVDVLRKRVMPARRSGRCGSPRRRARGRDRDPRTGTRRSPSRTRWAAAP